MIVVSTLLNAGYFLPIVYRAFFVPGPMRTGHAHGEAPVHDGRGAAWRRPRCTVLMFFFAELPLALARQLSRER